MDPKHPELHISVEEDPADAESPTSAAPATPISAVSESTPFIRQISNGEAELDVDEKEEIGDQEHYEQEQSSAISTSQDDADLAMALVLAEEEEAREKERYQQEQTAKRNSVPLAARGVGSRLSVAENAEVRGGGKLSSNVDESARSAAILESEPLQSPPPASYKLVDSGPVPKAKSDVTVKKDPDHKKISGNPAIVSTSILMDDDLSEHNRNSRKNSMELELGKITMRRGGKYRKSLENMLDPLPSAAVKRTHTIQEYKRTHGGAPASMQSLTDIRREVSSRRRHKRKRQSQNVCVMCFSGLISSIRKIFHVPSLWRGSLQNISSRFGSGILSYFAISRWLYVLNFTLACVWLIAVVGVGFGSEFLETNANGRPRLEVLVFGKQTGAGAFFSGQGDYSDTFFFYCFYRARMLGGYRMDLAYLVAIALFIIINFLGIVRRMRAEYVRKADKSSIAVDEVFPFGVVAFTGWDYGLRTVRGAKGHTFAIATVFKTLITADEIRQRARPKTKRERAIILLRRVIVNLIVFSMLGFSGYAIFQSISPTPVAFMAMLQAKVGELAQTSGASSDQKGQKSKGSMVTSILISSFNLVFPVVFDKLGTFEKWVDPQWEMRLALARSYVLKMAGIAIVLIGAQFGPNWETAIGQTFYQIFWLNFGITLLTTSIPPMLYKLIFREYKPFQITDNILELVYTQAVTWIGTISSPVILVFSVFTGFFVFHTKRIILLSFHEPPRRIYSSTAQSNFFLAFLLLTLLLSVFPIAYALAIYQPSCGPHGPDPLPFGQGRNGTFYQVVPEWVNGVQGWGSVVLRFVGSVAFIAPALGFLMLWVYGLKAVNLKTSRRLKLLEEEVAAEREDKRFLLRYYNVQT